MHLTYRGRFLNNQEWLGWEYTVVIATAKTWVCDTIALKNLVHYWDLEPETKITDSWAKDCFAS